MNRTVRGDSDVFLNSLNAVPAVAYRGIEMRAAYARVTGQG